MSTVQSPTTTRSKSWTVKVRERGVEALPPEKLLPDGQPTYVASWIYIFGVASIASLIVIIGSGSILALKGPAWWHYTGVGHFFNSIHMWAVELFFFVMVVHLWGKFWMAAWRGGRTRVWITGALTFLVAVPTALTGYVSQQNFDAQWISTQAKDGLNCRRRGRLLQRNQFRADVQLPRAAAAGGCNRPGGRPRVAGAPSRRGAALRAAPARRRLANYQP